MFTGLIQGLGEITSIQKYAGECNFKIKPLFDLTNIIDGESIAVNGVCLSIEQHDNFLFNVYASKETMSLTNLKSLKHGAKVNLERALEMGERLGGHLVSGHVDCIAKIKDIFNVGKSLKMIFTFPEKFSAEVISKGSIALNGISLTVNSCGIGFLDVNIIPETQQRTNIQFWVKDDEINMETDLIGKYVVKTIKTLQLPHSDRINRDFLAQNGFI